MSKCFVFLVVLCFSNVIAQDVPEESNTTLPNIILIVTDDQDVVLKGMVSRNGQFSANTLIMQIILEGPHEERPEPGSAERGYLYQCLHFVAHLLSIPCISSKWPIRP